MNNGFVVDNAAFSRKMPKDRPHREDWVRENPMTASICGTKQKPCRKRQRFSLIELLIVIAVIAILMGLLLPVLKKAREQATRILCLSNFKQCSTSIFAYAGDFNSYLPYLTDSHDPDYFRYGTYHLDSQLNSYIGSFKVWRCPVMKSAAPIDDPANTGNFRCTYQYWAGRHTSDNQYVCPFSITKIKDTTLVMQDLIYSYSGAWRANHSRGGNEKMIYSNNPSFWTFYDGYPEGMNVLFGDGHASWVNMSSAKGIYTTGSNWYPSSPSCKLE